MIAVFAPWSALGWLVSAGIVAVLGFAVIVGMLIGAAAGSVSDKTTADTCERQATEVADLDELARTLDAARKEANRLREDLSQAKDEARAGRKRAGDLRSELVREQTAHAKTKGAVSAELLEIEAAILEDQHKGDAKLEATDRAVKKMVACWRPDR